MRLYSQDITMEFEIVKCAILYNEKQKTTNDGKNRTTKSTKSKNAQIIRKLQVLGNI